MNNLPTKILGTNNLRTKNLSQLPSNWGLLINCTEKNNSHL
nr:MAG TPA: hypothetical protein [Caudoviricetes sp.]